MFKAGFFNKIGEENGAANIQEKLTRAKLEGLPARHLLAVPFYCIDADLMVNLIVKAPHS